MRDDDEVAFVDYEIGGLVVVIVRVVSRAGRVPGALMPYVQFFWAPLLFSSWNVEDLASHDRVSI